MVVQTHPMSIAEFDEFVELPQNADRLFEYIGGQVSEVPSNPTSSKYASRISGFIFMYLQQNDIGHLTGEHGGYMVSGERYAPDVAFISYETQPKLAEKGYNPRPPDLAIEVISDPDNPREQEDLRTKISHYLAAGTVVWVFNPERHQVEVHEPGLPLRFVDENGSLDGGDILPGFALKVASIFK